MVSQQEDLVSSLICVKRAHPRSPSCNESGAMAAIVNRPFKTVEETTGVEELVSMATLLVRAIVGRKEYHRPAGKHVPLP